MSGHAHHDDDADDHDDHDDGSTEHSEDVRAHSRLLTTTIKEADDIIAAHARGSTPEMRKKWKEKLPDITNRLRRLLRTQLDRKGMINKLDVGDGSYDNAGIDNALRSHITSVRNLNTNLNRLIGTRTVRKISGFITEDIPNFFTVKWRQLKDNAKQLLTAGALYGGVGGAAMIGGYTLATGDVMSGAALLGKHASIVGSHLAATSTEVGSLLSSAGANVSTMMGDTFHKISALLGGKI